MCGYSTTNSKKHTQIYQKVKIIRNTTKISLDEYEEEEGEEDHHDYHHSMQRQLLSKSYDVSGGFAKECRGLGGAGANICFS